MNFGILAIGLLAFCAAAPSTGLLVLDVVSMGQEARTDLQTARCARARAIARCSSLGACQ